MSIWWKEEKWRSWEIVISSRLIRNWSVEVLKDLVTSWRLLWKWQINNPVRLFPLYRIVFQSLLVCMDQVLRMLSLQEVKLSLLLDRIWELKRIHRFFIMVILMRKPSSHLLVMCYYLTHFYDVSLFLDQDIRIVGYWELVVSSPMSIISPKAFMVIQLWFQLTSWILLFLPLED